MRPSDAIYWTQYAVIKNLNESVFMTKWVLQGRNMGIFHIVEKWIISYLFDVSYIFNFVIVDNSIFFIFSVIFHHGNA